ncbi:MAG: heme ABC exporter ATP-binding protein CcmA [Candidatus Methylomirabilales bacterium]
MGISENGLAVEIRGLSRAYGATWALRGIDLNLREAETLVLLGPNGAGKTTLLKILATLLRPTRGGGKVLGYDLGSAQEAIRERIAVLGHQSYLYGDLTARENLRFFTVMGGKPFSEGGLEEVLHRVELGGHVDQRVRTFSSGMKRRLALARLLLGLPELLLLDEPYTNLDQKTMKLVNAFLQDYRHQGGTAVVATHHLSGGFAVADRIAMLKGGRIVFDEAKREMSLQALKELYALHVEGEGE